MTTGYFLIKRYLLRLKYFALLLFFGLTGYVTNAQSAITVAAPIDGGPGAILVINNDTVESVNLATGSKVPIFSVPTAFAFVLNDLAIDPTPLRHKIYFVKDNFHEQAIYYYDYISKTVALLTAGLSGPGITPASPSPVYINGSGASMADDGKLYIANQNMPGLIETRIYQLTLNVPGTIILAAKDYIILPSTGPSNPVTFGDFVIKNNMLIGTFFGPNAYKLYSIPPISNAIPAPLMFSTGNTYSQIATGWDGTIYTVPSVGGPIDPVSKIINIATGASLSLGIYLPKPGNPAANYKDIAGPVPATGKIKGNITCFPPNAPVNIYYDVNQDGALDPGDKFVTGVTTDINGDYSVGQLIPDFYIIECNGVTRATRFDYTGTFLNIQETWVQDISTSCTTLPVNLKANAYTHENTIVLRWNSNEDPGHTHIFEIEKSDDGINFIKIGTLNSADFPGKSDFQFIDKSALQGNNFYRIKQVNSNRKFIYSNIERVSYLTNGDNIQIFAGPERSVISIELIKAFSKSANVTIFNNLGQVVNTSSLPAGKLKEQIKLLSVASGLYYVRIENDAVHYVKKLMVQ